MSSAGSFKTATGRVDIRSKEVIQELVLRLVRAAGVGCCFPPRAPEKVTKELEAGLGYRDWSMFPSQAVCKPSEEC